ncbi:MAG: alpha-L-arabinofuranosidase [Chitinophagaceae bacterium]
MTGKYHGLTVAFCVAAIFAFSCGKKAGTTPPVVPPTDTTVAVAPAIDPSVANTIGFFLDDWQPKSFTTPSYNDVPLAGGIVNTVTVDASNIITKIPLSEFGHNAVWWMGPVAGDPKFIVPITNLHPHIIRFPGGSSSDAYFWNAQQDILPADAPLKLTKDDGTKDNPGYTYGKTNYNWQCNLDNYYSMLQQTNNKGIITVNYGYARYSTSVNPVAAAAHLAADWVRYDNGRTQLWEVGNENYGNWEWGYRIDVTANKDGQPEYLTGALYGQHFKIFVDSMQKAAGETGKKIYIGAVTAEAPAPEPWQTNTRKTWNAGMMPAVNGRADFYVAHNYFTPYNTNANADVILAAALTEPSTMMNYITQTLQANAAAIKPIAMDEWNITSNTSKQQVSNVSGVFATLVMGEALKNKYGMAARWDLLNGWSNGDDHGLFSSGDEPGAAKWDPRPSFYYMYFMQKMLGDRLVAASVVGNAGVKAYGSTFSSGQAGVALVNITTSAQVTEVKIKNFNVGSRFYWYSLEGSNDNGEFSRKVFVNGSGPAGVAGGPLDYATLKASSAATSTGIRVSIPPRGAVYIVVDKK